jgi:hypothetical protein
MKNLLNLPLDDLQILMWNIYGMSREEVYLCAGDGAHFPGPTVVALAVPVNRK